MNMLSCFGVAAGLSMDNFAVTIAAGCVGRGCLSHARRCLVSGCFAVAHILMFSAGWLGGKEVGHWIHSWDHWAAFLVLACIGIKMVKEAREDKQKPNLGQASSLRLLAALAVATSLDALGVGIALSLEQAPFWKTLWFMTGCVFGTSYVGFGLGRLLGSKFGTYMEVLGGIMLIGLGGKILLSGFGIW